MSTYGDMQNRIADELGRSGLTSQIQLCILDSVKHYERRRFGFNELNTTWSTVIGQEYYGASDNANIPTLVEIDTLTAVLLPGTSKLNLRQQTWHRLEILSLNTTILADPTDYAYYNLRIRLYPIPLLVRTMNMACHVKLTPLANSSDSNGWTNDCENLIRTDAKIRLLRDYIRGPEVQPEIEMLQQELAIIDAGLQGEAYMRQGSAGVRPTLF